MARTQKKKKCTKKTRPQPTNDKNLSDLHHYQTIGELSRSKKGGSMQGKIGRRNEIPYKYDGKGNMTQ